MDSGVSVSADLMDKTLVFGLNFGIWCRFWKKFEENDFLINSVYYLKNYSCIDQLK
jgi:hypothetical protein